MSQNNVQKLQIYEITNRDTGEKSYQAAYNEQDACLQAGWAIGDCFVITQKPRTKSVPDHTPQLLYKIHCLVCPFQYAECKKPQDEDCPTRPNAPELQDWLKQATEAHLCSHTGIALAKTDYQLGQKWVTIEKAIEELTAKP